MTGRVTSVPPAADVTDGPPLSTAVRRGLAWSTAANLTLRLGSVVLGIALARLLTPTEFGVFAVALAVHAVLMTLADLGLSADLIRSTHDFERKAPTVALLGLGLGGGSALLMAATSGPVATVLGSPDSAVVIAVLGLTLLTAGAGVVPYAALQRDFRQRELFAVALAEFLVSSAVTLVLVVDGMGALAIGIGRVVGAVVGLVCQFRLARRRPRYRLDRGVARAALGFGLPVAAANLLSWALLGIHTVVIARMLGPTVLGFYVLAFNVSTWPMSTLGQVVRSVALPGFSRVRDGEGRDAALRRAVALTWTAAVPAGGLLAVLAGPVVLVLYGEKWSPAVPVLVALGILGAARVLFDLLAAWLLAHGAATATLRVQLVWFVALAVAAVVGTDRWALDGAAWSHVAVALAVTGPAYLWAVRARGAATGPVLGVLWPPLLAAAPALLLAGWTARTLDGTPWLALLAGGLTGLAGYAVLVRRWALPHLREGGGR